MARTESSRALCCGVMNFGFVIFSSRANCCSDFTRQHATHSLIQIALWSFVRFAGGF